MNQDQLSEYARERNLIKFGQIVGEADLAAPDSDGMTPLMPACANDHDAVAGPLFGKGTDTFEIRDNTGKSTLMYAAATKQPEPPRRIFISNMGMGGTSAL